MILDLDETLVHTSNSRLPNTDYTFAYSDARKFNYLVPLLLNMKVYMKLRPFLNEFLEGVSKKYELILYTASNPLYADRILNYIEHSNKYFSHRIYRLQCITLPNRLYKPLDFLLSNRSIRDIVIVDNRVQCFSMNIRNGIPIKSFYGDVNDKELLKLAEYLDELSRVRDVRKKLLKDFASYFSSRRCYY